MQKFILKTLLLLLPIVIIAISLEYLLQQIPNDYVYKKSYLDKHSNEIEILILGASEPYYGINPVYFFQNTFNAAHVSQTWDLDFDIFNKYQSNFDNLKIIVLPISYATLWSKLENASDSWRMKNYALYYGINTKSLKDHSELLNNTLGNNLKRLYDYYFEKKNDIYCSEFGWGTSFKAGESNDLNITGKEAASRHTHDIHSEESMKIFAENIKILNSFAEFSNRNDIKLILLTLPVYHTYRENIDKQQLNKMIETLTDFTKEHNNILYFNWFEDPDFLAADFYDADHLNNLGAEKLSKKLAQFIDSLKVFDPPN